MEIKESLKKFWEFLKADTWQSWIVSMILIIILIKFILFPSLSFLTGSSLPLVVVESCSMYHETNFDDWWNSNAAFYESRGINKSQFQSFSLRGGLNKGDIVILFGAETQKLGDIIIYNSQTQYPLIHRVISLSPLATKGDHNSAQLPFEQDIQQNQLIGKAVAKIPLLGWIKLIFYEPFKSADQRGLCH